MILDDSCFFLDLKCTCGEQLASDSRSLYELKAWCSVCERRFRLVVIGKEPNGNYLYGISKDAEGK
jgi:hypothetical protein